MKQKLLYLLTRTSLHVGAGASVGAIDQPIQRERHTGWPIVPGSTIKGVFADGWTEIVSEPRVGEPDVLKGVRNQRDGVWLFGAEDANGACAGALQFSEAKLLVFPVRSAKGSFAWITSPLILRRAARDGVIPPQIIPSREPRDNEAIVASDSAVLLPSNQVVLEEYTFQKAEGDAGPVAKALQAILVNDPVWKEIGWRLVILSDGMMSFFAVSACEVAQHVRIDDATGTAAGGALFNQENVPSETMLYSVVTCLAERSKTKKESEPRSAEDAGREFEQHIKDSGNVFQFGADASTGLGYCTVELRDPAIKLPKQ